MEEENIYTKTRIIVRQLCDIMQRHELQDIGELKEWLEHNGLAPEIIQMLMDGSELSKEIQLYRQQNSEAAVQALRAQIRHYQRCRLAVRISRIAAAILILLGSGILYYRVSTPEISQSMVVLEQVVPSPQIITPDGICYNLSKIAADTLESGYNLNIAYKNDNEIKYVFQENPGDLKEEEALNQLIIPSQCNYQVTLTDGSVVRLNAESRLEYPTHFSGHERKVYLTGEAYFEVRHDGRPFVVESNGMTVRVYGTRFNINAYENENIETVLIEGKVGVSFRDGSRQEQILKPNQLCQVDMFTHEQKIQTVDIQKYISWTKGFLRYDNDPLEKLIKDLGRWYGAEFSFSSHDLKGIRISASINKDTSLQEVLTMIQATAKIKFNLIERRYIITR